VTNFHVLDFETASLCSLKEAGAWRYSEDVTTEVLCLSFEYRGEVMTWVPGGALRHVIPAASLAALVDDPTVIFVCFANFEKAIWRNIMVSVYGFPDIPDSRWHDLQAVAAMKALPQDLDTLLDALDFPRKDMEGSKLTISLSKIDPKTGMYAVKRTPEVLSRVYSYCESDVREERTVLDRIGVLQPGERRVWLLDQKINQRGIRIDLDYVRACQKVVREATVPLAQEFGGLTGGLAFTQVAKVAAWAGLPNLTKETVARVLGKNIDGDEDDDFNSQAGLDGDGSHLSEHVRRALEIRQLVGSSSVKKLPRMVACVGADGRARGLLQYCGTNSGRWAGRLFQPQNFPRPTFKGGDGDLLSPELIVETIMSGDWQMVEAKLGPAVEIVVNGLRHALIADKGKTFISGDYSQVELRGLMAHAGQTDKVEMLRDGISPYQDLAAQIFGRPVDKKKDPFEYDIGKHAVLGLGYQMGKGTFRRRYATTQPLEFCEKVTNTYRREWAPEVPKLWSGLEWAACETVWTKTLHTHAGIEFNVEGDYLTARLLSGRKLYFHHPHPFMKTMAWNTEDKPDIRKAWRYLATKNGRVRWVDAFGGMLTGVITQAQARDLMVNAMLKLEANGFPIVLTVHDEVVAEVPLDNLDEKAFIQCMTERPEWAKAINFPVKVETWTGERYRK
jgi:DNA polymerase